MSMREICIAYSTKNKAWRLFKVSRTTKITHEVVAKYHSRRPTLYTLIKNKINSSLFDDKRYISFYGAMSLAHRHYEINQDCSHKEKGILCQYCKTELKNYRCCILNMSFCDLSCFSKKIVNFI